MLKMKQIDVIEKRIRDTGIIDAQEMLQLIEVIRIKDHQLTSAVATIANLGRCPVDERTVN